MVSLQIDVEQQKPRQHASRQYEEIFFIFTFEYAKKQSAKIKRQKHCKRNSASQTAKTYADRQTQRNNESGSPHCFILCI